MVILPIQRVQFQIYNDYGTQGCVLPQFQILYSYLAHLLSGQPGNPFLSD